MTRTVLMLVAGLALVAEHEVEVTGAAGVDVDVLAGVGADAMSGTIPESVFFTFQMTFAIITPALIVGAFAERMKFSAMLLFMALWFTVCYAPMTHMVWSGDGALMWDWGVLDFAGGTVVHINAGMAALVLVLVIGARRGFGKEVMRPHNLPFTMLGAGLLWFGWFGFNVGSFVPAVDPGDVEARVGLQDLPQAVGVRRLAPEVQLFLQRGGQVLDDRGMLRTLPFSHGLEAFYAAAVVRSR